VRCWSAGKNCIEGEISGASFQIFEYKYTIDKGGGTDRSRTTHRQTVFAVESEKLNLPSFPLVPTSFLVKLAHKIDKGFGGSVPLDIDFPSHQTFSKEFFLYGEDENAVRSIFSYNVLEFFKNFKGVCVEGKENTLIIYKKSKRMKVGDLETTLEHGREVMTLFTG